MLLDRVNIIVIVSLITFLSNLFEAIKRLVDVSQVCDVHV